MTGTERALPSRTSAGAIVAPVFAGVLAALLLLAIGQAPTICTGVQACPEPGARLAVAIWWTIAVLVLAAITAALRLGVAGSAGVRWAGAAFGLLIAATVVGAIATLATGGFGIPLFYF